MKMCDIIQPVYQAFQCYPLLPNMEVCPCCTQLEEIEPLYSQIWDPVAEYALELYGAKAMSTRGGVKDFKHFLPKLLELEIYKNLGFHYLSSKLEIARFQEWPLSEQVVVKKFLTEYCILLINNDEGYDAEDLVIETRKVIDDFLLDNEVEILFKDKIHALIYNQPLRSEPCSFISFLSNVCDLKFIEQYILQWPEGKTGILSFSFFVNNIYQYKIFNEKTRPKIRKMKFLLETYWYQHANKTGEFLEEISNAVNVIETFLPEGF